jgi:hypothetical protein
MAVEQHSSLAALAAENARLRAELAEAREQQAATAEILRALSAAPAAGRPVLDSIVRRARPVHVEQGGDTTEAGSGPSHSSATARGTVETCKGRTTPAQAQGDGSSPARGNG